MDTPFLIRTLAAEIAESGGRNLLTQAHYVIYILSLIIYVFSPFDLIPEAIFGIIGVVDDLIVIGYIGVAIGSVFYQGLAERQGQAAHQHNE